VIPLFWPLAAFVAGILISPFVDPSSIWICLPLVILLAFARHWGVLLSFLLVGAGLGSLDPTIPPDPGDVAARVVGTLNRAPEWRGPGTYLDVQLQTIDSRTYYGRARLTEFLDDPELRAM